MAARRRGTRRPLRYSPPVDKSWHKKVNCGICGWEFTVNNHADRKSRIPKFMGVVICPGCTQRRTPLEKARNTTFDYIKLYRFIEPLAARGCLRPRKKKKGGIKVCGKCIPCQAGEVLKGCRANLPPLP